MRISLSTRTVATAALAFFAVGCADDPENRMTPTDVSTHQGPVGLGEGVGGSDIGGPIFDIAATPRGSIVFAEVATVREFDPRKGGVRDILTVPTAEGSAVNGIAPIGSRSFWVASAGLDLAVGAGLWRVSNGKARLVGDIEAFEIANDPDASIGTGWKVPACEDDPVGGFSAGPQSNPYHLESLGGGTAVVADAAGNSVLRGHAGGGLEVVAVLEPPTDENGERHVLKTLDDEDGTECYVQPVPTAVAADADGTLYVTELTGAPGEDMLATGGIAGESRVWRIESDAVNASCPSSDACELAAHGFSSLIDGDFGPDGRLYVLEYDANGWFQATVFGNAAGGGIFACPVRDGNEALHRDDCEVIAAGLTLPGAITFDETGHLWVVENHLGAPSIRTVAMP